MIEIIPQNIQFLLNSLSKSQLVGISFELTGVRLEFTSGIQGSDVIIQLFQVVHFMLSKDPDEQETFYVGRIDLTPLEKGGKEILSALLYPFKERDGTVVSYPSHPLFHLHIEGGVCIEAVCGSYQVFQEIKT